MSKVVVVRGKKHGAMVQKGLSELGINTKKRVVIKPNLIDNRPYPVTTNVKTVEGIVRYFRDRSREIVIAEGSGWCTEGTLKAFVDLGYSDLVKGYGAKLVDLNEDEYELRGNPEAFVLKRFEFPKTLKDSYLISTPVLKRHSICKVTLSLKNMIGSTILANKGRFHSLGIDESIVDINLYKRPDLAIIDGVEGNVGMELELKPKRFKVMIFSEDPVAADAVGAKVLGVDPQTVRHLKLAQERGLGIADLNKIKVKKIFA